jgi:hypothetical protein
MPFGAPRPVVSFLGLPRTLSVWRMLSGSGLSIGAFGGIKKKEAARSMSNLRGFPRTAYGSITIICRLLMP